MVPITLGSGASLVVKIGTNKIMYIKIYINYVYGKIILKYYKALLIVNISGNICLIGLCKVSKEAAQQARFNGSHHFEVRCPSGGENWNQKNYLTIFSVF